MLRRPLLVLPLALLAAIAGSAQTPASGATFGASCRTAEVQVHDEAVFGHFATVAAANTTARRAKHLGFQGIKIENDGCGDYEVEIDGADKSADRGSFAAEAQKAGFPVTFEQTAPPLMPRPGDTYGVFGTFRGITAANALALRLATVNFRYIDIGYKSGNWLVVMPQVPIRAALSIAAEVHKAGFRIAFRSG
jgi:hypothetical protein